MGAFGEKLRKQREQRGLALDAISNTTKISTRMLRALEEEHFDQLPGGVFNKGFVRAYARQVGLDEEETVTDYLTALRESQVQSQKILPDFRNSGAKSAPTPSDSRHHVLPADSHPGSQGEDNGRHNLPTAERRRNDERRNEVRRTHDRAQPDTAPQLAEPAKPDRIEAAAQKPRPQAGSLPDRPLEKRHRDNVPESSPSFPAGFITRAEGMGGSEESEESTETSRSGISKTMIAAAALLLVILAGLAIWNSRRNREQAPDSAAQTAPSGQGVSSPAAQPPAPTQASASAATRKVPPASSLEKAAAEKSSAPAPVPSSTSSTAGMAPKPAAPTSSSADSRVMKSATSSATAKPLPTFTLMIRADQTTWISVIADGKPEMHETLIAPAHTSVRATRDVTVKVGNAAGVSFQLNGKEFPAQGNAGEVRSYVFDAEGMRPGPPVASPAANR